MWSAAGDRPRSAWGIPANRERTAIHEAIIREKLGCALLPAMRAADVDMWVVLDRENAPDPLREELGGGYPGRGAAFVFWQEGSRVERIYIGSSRQPFDSLIERTFDRCLVHEPSREAFARALREVIEVRGPRRIAVNVSQHVPAADGLTVSGRQFLLEALGDSCAERLVSSEVAVHRFRSTRSLIETMWYRRLQEWTCRWLGEALDAGLIRIGTTVRALADACEDRAIELGFMPIADHGRYSLIVWLGDRASIPGVPVSEQQPTSGFDGSRDTVIEAGSLVTLDGGLRFVGLSSDMKRSAYILRRGERQAPASLRGAWQRMLEAADICAAHLRAGNSGTGASRQMGIDLAAAGFAVDGEAEAAPRVVLYGHAVGNDVHEVGARLHLPPRPADRDWPLVEGEWISIEFHVATAGEEGRPWYVRFEQTGQVTTNGFEWLAPLQRDLMTIGLRHGEPSADPRRTRE